MITVKGGGHGKVFGPDVGKNVANFFDHHLLGKMLTGKTILSQQALKRENVKYHFHVLEKQPKIDDNTIFCYLRINPLMSLVHATYSFQAMLN